MRGLNLRFIACLFVGLCSATLLILILSSPGSVQAAGFKQPTCQTSGEPANFDPFKLYGDRISFRVDRNGSPVGFHRVKFQQSPKGLIVESHFEIKISFLMFTAYHYIYRSESRWQGDCLISLTATTNDDGNETVVQAHYKKGRLQLKGPSDVTSVELGVYPTNHWHPGILAQERILNTITGRVNRIQIANKGVANVQINGAEAQANHYVYSGELKNELWYDQAGRWVKMRFKGDDGSVIEYFCQQCQRMNQAERK